MWFLISVVGVIKDNHVDDVCIPLSVFVYQWDCVWGELCVIFM